MGGLPPGQRARVAPVQGESRWRYAAASARSEPRQRGGQARRVHAAIRPCRRRTRPTRRVRAARRERLRELVVAAELEAAAGREAALVSRRETRRRVAPLREHL